MIQNDYKMITSLMEDLFIA